MDYEFILSQVFVVLSYFFVSLTYFSKNRKVLLFYSISSIIMGAVSYFLLSAWSGLFMSAVALIRNIIFLIQNKKNESEKITWIDWIILSVFMIISIITAVYTYEGFLSLFSVLATMLYTISVWQKNKKAYKVMGVIISVLWIIYYVFIGSIFGVFCEVILLISEIVSVVRCFKYENKQEEASL